jgi:exportin-1
VFVLGLSSLHNDPLQFKLHVRDFLVQLGEYAGNTADLFLEEREAELLAKEKAEREKAMRVPGLIKPSDLPTMDED